MSVLICEGLPAPADGRGIESSTPTLSVSVWLLGHLLLHHLYTLKRLSHSLARTHTLGKEVLLRALINNSMHFEKIACRRHFFCGYLDVNVLCCDRCSGVLSGVTVRCGTAVFTRGTTYLQVWFSVSQRVIYGIASAVPCEWCKDKPSLGPQIAAERIKVSGCRVTQPTCFIGLTKKTRQS